MKLVGKTVSVKEKLQSFSVRNVYSAQVHVPNKYTCNILYTHTTIQTFGLDKSF